MARLWQSGFEGQQKDILSGLFTGGGGVGGSFATGITRGDWSVASLDPGDRAEVRLPSTYTELYVRVPLYLIAAPSSSNRGLITFRSPSGVQCQVMQTTGKIYGLADGNGTQYGTSTWEPVLGRWYTVEVYAKIGDATAGQMILRVDGTNVIDTGGVDTRVQAETTIDRLAMEAPFFTGNLRIDDVAVNDISGTRQNSWCNDGKIIAIYPNAAGDATQLLIGGSSPPASNWQAVDEQPPNDGVDYVYSATIDQRDLYNCNDLPSGVLDVVAVMQWVRAQKSDAGAASIADLIKSGGTESLGATQVLSTSWATYSRMMMDNPVTAAQWTIADVNAVQIGAQVK